MTNFENVKDYQWDESSDEQISESERCLLFRRAMYEYDELLSWGADESSDEQISESERCLLFKQMVDEIS